MVFPVIPEDIMTSTTTEGLHLIHRLKSSVGNVYCMIVVHDVIKNDEIYPFTISIIE